MSTKASPFYLDLLLTVTGGSFNVVGRLRLFCWLKAIRNPGFEPRGRRVVVQPSEPGGQLEPREQEFEPGRVEGLVKALQDLGFPERPLQVEPVFDTSDVWEHVVLRVTLNDATAEVNLGLLASGFDGEDAEGLREVFRRLLDVVGLRRQSGWYNLTGEHDE